MPYVKRSVTGAAIRDITGTTFGRLTVICLLPKRVAGDNVRVYWFCRCSCGREIGVRTDRLRSGNTKSCGCLARSQEGKSKTPEYRIWQHMIDRCYLTTDPKFSSHGGRGIRVCNGWRHSFLTFLRDMGPRPSPDHSIDRTDNDGHYRPQNCRWATRQEQARNTRANRLLTLDGQTMTMTEWAEIKGLSVSLVYHRLRIGWSTGEALNTPVHIQVRGKRLPPLTKEQVEDLYHQHGDWKSVQESLGCTKVSLLRLRKKLGIPIRPFHWRQ